MNTLILLPEEMIEDSCAEVRGERAARLQGQQDLCVGQSIRVSVLQRFCAWATVSAIENTRVCLSLGMARPLPPRMPVSIFVAVPRPQTVKKIISLAVQAGVENLFFVRSYLTVASYLQSHCLRPEDIEQEAIKALEQVWDCTPPRIRVIDRMGEFFERVLPELSHGSGDVELLLAEPLTEGTRSMAAISKRRPLKRVVLGIGPEKGWSAAEQEGFTKSGFSLVHIDEREYRVETALAFLIGQLKMVLSSD